MFELRPAIIGPLPISPLTLPLVLAAQGGDREPLNSLESLGLSWSDCSLPMIGAMSKPAIGLAHHHPNNCIQAKASEQDRREIRSSVCLASALIVAI